VAWLYPKATTPLCACPITAEDVEFAIQSAARKPAAVYLTSPDYLGGMQDIRGISKVCKTHDIPLLVDNAHGAYLAFLEENRHPIALGATMCCDSAHKTLPVLTGGAYLHISKDAPESFVKSARSMLALFASTSPSYLILQSLDLCNRYLAEQYAEKLALCIKRLDSLKKNVAENGIFFKEGEPLKLVLETKPLGYTGEEMASYLRAKKIEIEFADPDFAVFMVTPENSTTDFEKLERALLDLPKKTAKTEPYPSSFTKVQNALSIREAVFAPKKTVPVTDAEGLICASPLVSCPPAVPIVMSGEVITEEAIKKFLYYGTEYVDVIAI
jgi:arginine/lysine/ornithine decarboxylase